VSRTKKKAEALKKAEKIVADLFAKSNCADPMDRKKDRMHSLKAREWVLEMEPQASSALQIAALAHDIDRTIERRRAKVKDFATYEEYKKQHAKESANIICEELEKEGFNDNLIERVRYLIEHHEVGGDKEANILKDADSLTFFNMDIYPYLKGRGSERTREKIKFMYERLSDNGKRIVDSIEFRNGELRALFKKAKQEMEN